MKITPLKISTFTILSFIFLIAFPYYLYNQFSVIHNNDDLRTALGRLCFEQLQTTIYAIGIIMLYVLVYNKISWKLVFQHYVISFLFIIFNGNVIFHEFLVANDLYLKFTQTNTPFFLHAFGVFAVLVSLFSLGYLLFVKPTLLKIFTVFLGASFYIFFCILHLFLGRQAYIDYLEHYEVQISSVLENQAQYKNLCIDLDYQCFVLNNDQLPHIIISEKNKMKKNVDVDKEVIEVYNHFKNDFIVNKYSQKIYLTESFTRKNLRAMNFAFKKIDQKLFVIISSTTFAYGLDLYLFYITLLTFTFFLIWTYLLIKLNKFHSKLPWLKQTNLL